MTKTIRRCGILGVAGVALVFAVAAFAGGDDEATDRGWLVVQEGRAVFYPFQEEWIGEPNPSGFTVTNAKKKLTVYYYGTFRAEHREKGG